MFRVKISRTRSETPTAGGGAEAQTDWNQDWTHAWGLAVWFFWADGVKIASYKVGKESQALHLKPGPWWDFYFLLNQGSWEKTYCWPVPWADTLRPMPRKLPRSRLLTKNQSMVLSRWVSVIFLILLYVITLTINSLNSDLGVKLP